MPTYLYCLLTRAEGPEAAPPATRGLAGAPVRVLSAGPLDAWVSSVATTSPVATVEAIRAHDAVVGAALATGRTPLPARFGQVWPADAECVAAVSQRSPELEPVLRGIAGLVEMTVCTLALGTSSPAAAPGVEAAGDVAPGRAYLARLRARAERERHLRATLETVRARVSRAVGSTTRGEVAEIRAGHEALTLSMSYLVERGGEAEFRRAVEDVARESATRLVVAGPRAPYSFTPGARTTGLESAVGRSSR